jgi:formate dehydrogenase subunit gamma
LKQPTTKKDDRISTMTTSPLSPGAAATVQDVLARLAAEPGALLPILHALQDTLGYVPPDAVPTIADALNVSRAEVHGVISYYHHFRSSPPTPHTLQVCRAEACQAMGAEALLAHARQHLGCGLHAESGDGSFTVEPAYCLGLCASSPAITLDGQVHARMTPHKLDALVAQAREAA